MALKIASPFFLANVPGHSQDTLEVHDKYTGKLIALVSMVDAKTIENAMQAANNARKSMQQLSSFERQEILNEIVKQLKERREELAVVICQESGKPIRDAKTEVERAINTFQIAAFESTRILGEFLPLDTTPRGKGFAGIWKRVAIGPCLFITPFNFPLNLVAHKVAPAIAAGCPFILKPSSQTPLSALILGEILSSTRLPKGAFSILPCSNENAELMVIDDRLKLLSFTGSAKVGWELKQKSGKKKVILELGGNAACIIDENVDIDNAVDRLIFGAFYQSGQSCISVQRILIHASVYAPLTRKLLDKTIKLTLGNPLEPETFIGPLISEKDAIRIHDWIQEAVKAGANLLCGGKRAGAFITPALLEKVPHHQKLNAEEAFGPVAVLEKFENFKDALDIVNQSRYGLQAGVFTRDLYKVHQAWDTLEVGAVIINEIPSWRADNMPYGGVKDSGLGREGVHFAIDHLTEIRLLAINTNLP